MRFPGRLVPHLPQAVELFSDLTCQISLEFLIAYLTATEAQTQSVEAFEAFLRRRFGPKGQTYGYTRLSFIPIRDARFDYSKNWNVVSS